jgi:hypothetical protein
MMTMNREKRIWIISKLVAQHKALDSHFDILSKTLGSQVGSPFFDCMYKAMDSYLESVSEWLGDDFGWINWFIHENDYGKRAYAAKPSKGRKRKIRTVENLVDIIEADL